MPTTSWGYLKDEEEGKLIQSNLTSLQNNNEDFINWYKNHLLIKLFLESKKCNWLWNGCMEIPIEFKEFNRFDGDYKNFLDKGVDGIHSGPKHNQSYAINLLNHIYLNFKEYLNKDLIIKQNLI